MAKDLAGTDLRAINLDSALGALPNGAQARDHMAELLDTLSATGTRRPQGSATEFNSMISRDLEAPSIPIATVATAGTAAPRLLGNYLSRRWRGANVSKLADMFLDPNSVSLIEQATARGNTRPGADALRRMIAQTPIVMGAPTAASLFSLQGR